MEIDIMSDLRKKKVIFTSFFPGRIQKVYDPNSIFCCGVVFFL